MAFFFSFVFPFSQRLLRKSHILSLTGTSLRDECCLYLLSVLFSNSSSVDLTLRVWDPTDFSCTAVVQEPKSEMSCYCYLPPPQQVVWRVVSHRIFACFIHSACVALVVVIFGQFMTCFEVIVLEERILIDVTHRYPSRRTAIPLPTQPRWIYLCRPWQRDIKTDLSSCGMSTLAVRHVVVMLEDIRCFDVWIGNRLF